MKSRQQHGNAMFALTVDPLPAFNPRRRIARRFVDSLSRAPHFIALFVRGLAAALLCSPLCVQAGGSVTGTISQVIVRQSDGLTYAYINGATTGKPSCATSSYFIISGETTDAGHKLYAMLLSAKLAGSTVTVTGDGTCSRWPDGENILTVQLVG